MLKIKNVLVLMLFFITTIVVQGKEVDIVLLGTSDVHGRVVPWSYAADEEDKSGSYAQISTLVNEIRANNKNVFLF